MTEEDADTMREVNRLLTQVLQIHGLPRAVTEMTAWLREMLAYEIVHRNCLRNTDLTCRTHRLE